MTFGDLVDATIITAFPLLLLTPLCFSSKKTNIIIIIIKLKDRAQNVVAFIGSCYPGPQGRGRAGDLWKNTRAVAPRSKLKMHVTLSLGPLTVSRTERAASE